MAEAAKQERLFSPRALRKLIIPLIFEQGLALTVGMADSMMVSSAGEAAISGVSLVDMINGLIFNILAALATGGAVVTSQYIGAREEKLAQKSARQLLYTVLVAGLMVAAAAILARNPLLDLLFGSIEQDVRDNALIYLIITACSFPFMGVYNACAALFRSMGKSQITLNVSIIVNIINVAGNAICIFGLHMGAAGVAIPSLVSRAVGGIVLYILLRNPKHAIHFERGRFHWDFAAVKKILHIGVPSGIENGLFQLGRIVVVSIVSGLGTAQIAANGVANTLDGMGIIIGQAMNLAMITVIGQCVGAGDEGQVRYYLKKLLLICYAASGVLEVLLFTFVPQILLLYNLSDETAGLVTTLVRIHSGCGIFLWPMAFNLPNMLRAWNDVKYTMVVSILSMAIFRVGSSYILGLHFGLGVVGVWIAMVIDWVVRIAFFLGRYFSGKWRELAHLPAPEKRTA